MLYEKPVIANFVLFLRLGFCLGVRFCFCFRFHFRAYGKAPEGNDKRLWSHFERLVVQSRFNIRFRLRIRIGFHRFRIHTRLFFFNFR